jgi:cellulose synthase/poly-beta-1,6-N-acetylglucosamine synthase-like glycosyltransferase
MSWVYTLALWFAPAANPVSDYWSRNMDPLKNPFRGLYQMNSFDLAIMLPYFIVMVILAVYGTHRYALVYRFFKHRKNVAPPPPEIEKWPKVTVQLPIYNERYVIERLIEAVVQFDYPRELLDIQVLDDSSDETQEVASSCVQRHRDLGLSIAYIHRTNREGFKAGALQNGLQSANGELIAIFDADFIPPADFLRRTVPYFVDPKLAMVQTRWSYINRNYSPLTECEAILLDGHFAIEHSSRFRSRLFFNFNGTAGTWRRVAIHDAGGWQHDTLTEDTDLSYRAQLRGWHFLYLPEIDCPSELPVEMNAFKTQQARWAKGLMQTAKKVLPQVMRSNVPPEVKAEAFFHLTANISYPLMVLLSIILLPAMIVRFYQGWFQVLVIDLPLFVASTCSISSFYLAAERTFYPKTWKRTFLYLPFVMALGIGLSVRNALAVIEALFGVKSEFARTPKYRIESKATPAARVREQARPEPARHMVAAASASGSSAFVYNTGSSAPAQGEACAGAPSAAQSSFGSDAARSHSGAAEASHQSAWIKKGYRKGAGWMPWVEVGLGLYFAGAVVYAAQNQNYATLPFLVLFVWGYLYTGFMSLGQTYFERLRLRFASAIPAPAPTPAPAAATAAVTTDSSSAPPTLPI